MKRCSYPIRIAAPFYIICSIGWAPLIIPKATSVFVIQSYILSLGTITGIRSWTLIMDLLAAVVMMT